MQPVVKSRRYDSPHRRAQAQATRRAILDAAPAALRRTQLLRDLDARSLKKPALLSRPSTCTSRPKPPWYTRFGTPASAATEADLPVLEREWYRAVVNEPDPERKLRLVAAQSRRVKSRSGALLEMIRAAAPADSEIATLWSDIEAKLLDVQRSIVEQLTRQDRWPHRSTSPGRPTSSGPSTIPPSGNSWSWAAAGPMNSTSDGSVMPSARSSSTAAKVMQVPVTVPQTEDQCCPARRSAYGAGR